MEPTIRVVERIVFCSDWSEKCQILQEYERKLKIQWKKEQAINRIPPEIIKQANAGTPVVRKTVKKKVCRK